MDAVFSQSDRSSFLRSFLRSFGGAYICLWSYSPQPTHSHLFFRDGYLYEDNTNPGSSAPSLARRLFDEYCHEMFFLVNGRVPGLAFVNNQPYRELNQFELQTMSSIAVQRQFYQEAKIKTAVFLGCGSGEIEMGWSNGIQANMENLIRTWFSSDVILQQQSSVDPNRVSSTSSSPPRSLSIDSPESSSLLFTLPSSTSHIPEIVPLEPSTSLQPIPSTSSSPLHEIMQHIQPTDQALMQSLQQQQLRTTTTTAPVLQQQMQPWQLQQLTTTATTAPLPQQQMESFVRNLPLPNQQSDEEAITRAILAVLTSPSPSFTTSSSFRSPMPPLNPKASAFKKYRAPSSPARHNLLRQTMLKRSIIYYRSLNIARREHLMSSTRPTTTQLHHMISERKRREKINESFEALRKLLPPEAKKDKASVLTRTREYLKSLRAQVERLDERNRELEGQLLLPVEDSSSERVGVRITHVTESTSEEQRIINLQVVLRGESSVSDMVVRILEFLRQDRNVNVISMEASTISEDSKRVILRLKIEGNEWDESAFQEAIKRVVADLL